MQWHRMPLSDRRAGPATRPAPDVHRQYEPLRYGIHRVIEAAEGITTGVSAADRIRTIRTAVAPDARPESLARPGHVFPLAARSGGVLERGGHTEGSVDLTKLAGLPPCAVLCELTNEDGTMARLPEVVAFACEHDFPIVSIDDIRRYRTEREAARTDL